MRKLIIGLVALSMLLAVGAGPVGAGVVSKVVAEQEDSGWVTTGIGGLDVSHTCLPGTRPFLKVSMRYNQSVDYVPRGFYYLELEGERYPWSPTSGTFSKTKQAWTQGAGSSRSMRPSNPPFTLASNKPMPIGAWKTQWDKNGQQWMKLSGPDGGKITHIAADYAIGKELGGTPTYNKYTGVWTNFNPLGAAVTTKVVYGCEDSP